MKNTRYLRHKRGGGKICSTSEACELSVIDRASLLGNKTSVWSATVINSTVLNSQVTSARLENSFVQDSRIHGGSIFDSLVSAELISGQPTIENSTVSGKTRIGHCARLSFVKIKNLTVGGDAELIGWHDSSFDGLEGYIMRGVWKRPPRVMSLGGNLSVTESVPGFGFVGCREYEISKWLKIGDRAGKLFGLSNEEVHKIRDFLRFISEAAL